MEMLTYKATYYYRSEIKSLFKNFNTFADRYLANNDLFPLEKILYS